MPRYKISGKTIESQTPLSDEEIDEIASGMPEAPKASLSDLPVAPGLSLGQAAKFAKGALWAGPKKMLGGLASLPGAQMDLQKRGSRGVAKSLLEGELPSLEDTIDLTAPGLGMAKGMLDSSLDQSARYAQQIDQEEDPLVKAGLYGQSALSAFPLTTPFVETGERFIPSDISKPLDPEAGGELAFDAASAVLGPEHIGAGLKAVPGLGKIVPKLGKSLEAGAIQRYGGPEGALRPPKRLEGLALRTGKEALDRGLWGSLESLKGSVEDILEGAGKEIQEFKSSKNIPLDEAKSIARNALDKAIEVGNKAKAKTAEELLYRLDELGGESGEIPYQRARDLRADLEANPAKSGAYIGDPALAYGAKLEKKSADALRGKIHEVEPSIQPADQSYSFGKNMEKLLGARRRPMSVLNAGKMGGLGGIASAVVQKIIRGPRLKTGSALLQYRVAKMLQSGNIPEAARLAGVEFEKLDLPEESLDLSQLPREEPYIPPQEIDSKAPNYWGGEPKPEFSPSLEGMSEQERLLTRMDLTPNKEAGINADQARLAREYLQSKRPPRTWEGRPPEEFKEPFQPLELTDNPSEIADFRRPAEVKEPDLYPYKGQNQPKLKLPDKDLQMLLDEFDHIGFMPEDLAINDPKSLKIVQRADDRATQAAIRTIKNKTYQSLDPAKKLQTLEKIFQRHRGQALKGRLVLDSDLNG